MEWKTKELLRAIGGVNTYALTKGLTERMLLDERGTLPMCIVRPSVVGAAFREPMPVNPMHSFFTVSLLSVYNSA